MINRVLIRIKVVQMLYSYLLTEKLFTIESQPEPPTKEKRFAYSLYLGMLALMVEIADNLTLRGGARPLADNRFICALRADDKVRSVILRRKAGAGGVPMLEQATVDRLTAAVKDSAILKDYRKLDAGGMNADLKVWQDLYRAILLPDSSLAAMYAGMENFSPRGVERMQEMMLTTFVNFSSSQALTDDALKALRTSLDKARELYFRLLLLPVEITSLQDRNLDAARHKYIVTDEDLNPNLRFVENQFVARLADDEKLKDFVSSQKLSWYTDNLPLLEELLRDITESDLYKQYMDAPSTDFDNDCEFWRNIMRTVVLPSDALAEALEDQSVFWNDDLDIIGTFVVKTIRRFKDKVCDPILPQYKDEEDARFGAELFRDVVKHKDEYRALINEVVNTQSWDTERLAFMDVVIALTAIAEIVGFPKIPVNVTVNEYIETAKSYSTGKSGAFINGILGAVIRLLRERGVINKG